MFGNRFKAVFSMQKGTVIHMQQNKLQSGWYRANNDLTSYYQTDNFQKIV